MSSEIQIDSAKPELYINRELSWLKFNDRVLEEALDPSLPLYERLKFLGIISTNLDEFFMVRVAGLKQQQLGGVTETPADGLLPAQQLAAISEHTHRQVGLQYRCWREDILPALAEQGIRIVPRDQYTSDQRAETKEYFREKVFPVLTPLAVDPGHPFPHLRNKSINVAVLLGEEGRAPARHSDEPLFAVVQVPSIFSRVVPLRCAEGYAFTMLGDLICDNVSALFPGYTVTHASVFRVTRNWDLSIDEDESEDLLSTIEDELRRRDRGAAVRLEIDARASEEIERVLATALNLESDDVYRIGGPLQINDLYVITKANPKPELKVEPLPPVVPRAFRGGEPVLEVMRRGDILLHHPFESYDPVSRFIEEAADDPDVLAIKQTLYRTGPEGPIIRALSRAAANGKQVAVLIELKARFDEERNIEWARDLEESGVHVVYGVVGLKTHCKVTLVVRREAGGISRYIHLGTGNYNPETARQYTDLSLFTMRKPIADDVSALFNLLTGHASAPNWNRLAVAPFDLQKRILQLIERETERARKGGCGRIIAKMNSLVDPATIRALYEASRAGVQIDLIVRGICCLRPGVPEVSENIRVRSIVDRFLEHSRIFAFGEGRESEVYMSSADWMPRNFLRRVEVMAPIEDAQIRHRLVHEILGTALADNVKARVLRPDGTYEQAPRGEPAVRSQIALYEAAKKSLEPVGPVLSPVTSLAAGGN